MGALGLRAPNTGVLEPMGLRIARAGLIAVGCIAWVGACSSSPSSSSELPVSGAAGQSAPAAGAPAGGGGSASAGSPAAGASGTQTGGGPAGVAGAGSGSAGMVSGGAGGIAGAGGAAAASQGPFACTEYIGAYLSMEWWGTGFESNTGIDNAKWQLKWHHHGHVLEWAKPDSPFWANTGDPLNDASGAPIQSACASNSATPDRVVFLALSWELLNEDDWVAALNADIATIKLKLPSVKWIDLQTMVRCPNDMQCNPGAKYGPGADTDATRQDCEVYPYVDSALAKVVAAHADFVGLGPQLSMAMCNPAHNGAHMTADGNKQAAVDMAAYYSKHL